MVGSVAPGGFRIRPNPGKFMTVVINNRLLGQFVVFGKKVFNKLMYNCHVHIQIVLICIISKYAGLMRV